MFSRAWHRLHVFKRLAPVVCFPALGTGYMFSSAWHRLHVFLRLASVVCSPAFGTGVMFSRAWHRLYVLPRLASVSCFPELGIGCMFSRVWHRFHVFPLLALVACFPAFGNGYIFSALGTSFGVLIPLDLDFHRKTISITPIHIFLLSFMFYSKKDSEQRRKELLEGISPVLLQLVEKNAQELMFDKGGCQLVLATLLNCTGEWQVNFLAWSNKTFYIYKIDLVKVMALRVA